MLNNKGQRASCNIMENLNKVRLITREIMALIRISSMEENQL